MHSGRGSVTSVWNFLVVWLLLEIRHPQTYIQVYADDIVLLFQGCDMLKLHETASRCLSTVSCWADDCDLTFSAEKSEAIVFTWRRH